MIGRLEKTVIDCPDPRALAEFYCQVLGMRVNEDIGDWVVIGLEPGLRQLAFQRATEWVPPRWPDPAYPQQLHLDIRVSDADQAEQELLLLGATRVPGERETGFRVFADPVGHPFCIVFGRHSTGWTGRLSMPQRPYSAGRRMAAVVIAEPVTVGVAGRCVVLSWPVSAWPTPRAWQALMRDAGGLRRRPGPGRRGRARCRGSAERLRGRPG